MRLLALPLPDGCLTASRCPSPTRLPAFACPAFCNSFGASVRLRCAPLRGPRFCSVTIRCKSLPSRGSSTYVRFRITLKASLVDTISMVVQVPPPRDTALDCQHQIWSMEREAELGSVTRWTQFAVLFLLGFTPGACLRLPCSSRRHGAIFGRPGALLAQESASASKRNRQR